MKSKLLWLFVLLLIGGSWIGNIWYYQSMQLADPLFLNHNIIINGEQGKMINLTFLQNKNAENGVTGVQIEEMPQLHFNINEKSNYSHQVMNMASAQWRPDRFQGEKEPFTIREVTVYYNEGQPRKVPIGEINVVWNISEGLLEGIYGSSSSTGSGSAAVRLTKPASLEKVDYIYSEKMKPWFKLELSGAPIESLDYPLEMDQGDSMLFTYQWSIPDNEPEAMEVFESKIMLHFLTEDGRTVIEDIPINHNFYISDHQLKRLVRSGGELR